MDSDGGAVSASGGSPGRGVASEEEMSMGELRDHLIDRLRATGVVDQMKANLRARFVGDLRLRGKVVDAGGRGPPSLHDRVVDSLVADHLRARSYDCTQSVFLPETRLGPDALTRTELLSLWTKPGCGRPPFMQHAAPAGSLLDAMVKHVDGRAATTETSAQTDAVPEPTMVARLEILQGHQDLEAARTSVRERELEVQTREFELEHRLRARDAEAQNRDVAMQQKLDARAAELVHLETSLQQRMERLVHREEELKRAAALDARSVALDEDRLQAMEKLVALRLAEADATVDALESAQHDAQRAATQWQAEKLELVAANEDLASRLAAVEATARTNTAAHDKLVAHLREAATQAESRAAMEAESLRQRLASAQATIAQLQHQVAEQSRLLVAARDSLAYPIPMPGGMSRSPPPPPAPALPWVPAAIPPPRAEGHTASPAPALTLTAPSPPAVPGAPPSAQAPASAAPAAPKQMSPWESGTPAPAPAAAPAPAPKQMSPWGCGTPAPAPAAAPAPAPKQMSPWGSGTLALHPAAASAPAPATPASTSVQAAAPSLPPAPAPSPPRATSTAPPAQRPLWELAAEGGGSPEAEAFALETPDQEVSAETAASGGTEQSMEWF